MRAHDALRYGDSVEGIDVEKRYDEAEFPFPSVVYDLESTRPETVAIRIVDVIPDAVDQENVGFHADYDGDRWSVDGNRLVYERELEPDTECRTIYAVSATATDDPSELFVEPSVIEVSPPAPENDDVTVALSEPGDEPEQEPELMTNGGTTRSTEPAGTGLASLAAQVEDDDYEPADLETVAAAVADALGESSGSVDARLSRIESDVAELRAYTDALAEFLDEEGGAAAVVEQFDGRVSAVETDLESVRSRTEGLERDAEALRGEISDLETLPNALDELSAEVEDLRSRLGQTGSGPSVSDRLDSLEERTTEMEEFMDSVRTAFE